MLDCSWLSLLLVRCTHQDSLVFQARSGRWRLSMQRTAATSCGCVSAPSPPPALLPHHAVLPRMQIESVSGTERWPGGEHVSAAGDKTVALKPSNLTRPSSASSVSAALVRAPPSRRPCSKCGLPFNMLALINSDCVQRRLAGRGRRRRRQGRRSSWTTTQPRCVAVVVVVVVVVVVTLGCPQPSGDHVVNDRTPPSR